MTPQPSASESGSELLALPRPPDAMLEGWDIPVFERSEEMEDFIRRLWIDGAVFPAEAFQHLEPAKIGVLWANTVVTRRGTRGRQMVTAGLAEIFEPRPAKRWIMDRQTAYMHHLFGWELPDFVITLDAQYWAADLVCIATKLGLITHELCHCGQKEDRDGNPTYVQSGPRRGEPAWTIVPHDVEQFDLVVEWFGADAAGVRSIVDAAAEGAAMRDRVEEAFGESIGVPDSFPCATCGRRAA